MEKKPFRSGFVAIIGRPNVGKSTITNALVGEKVSIVSPKPQTTRNRVMGVINTQNAQLILLDTPGVHTPKTELGKYMEHSVKDALQGRDGVMVMVDARGLKGEEELRLLDGIHGQKDALIGINKIDLVPEDRRKMLQRELEEKYRVPVKMFSAKTGEGVEELKEYLIGLLGPGPQYFPSDALTDLPEEFLAGELIREQALLHLSDEIPHGIGVSLERFFQREDGIVEVHAVLYCEKNSHKGIIIGRNGSMLKRISTEARHQLEAIFSAPVYLRVFVKVRQDWRNSNAVLRELGYR